MEASSLSGVCINVVERRAQRSETEEMLNREDLGSEASDDAGK